MTDWYWPLLPRDQAKAHIDGFDGCEAIDASVVRTGLMYSQLVRPTGWRVTPLTVSLHSG
jgi:hypothetical protein